MTPTDLKVLEMDSWFGAVPAAIRSVLLREARLCNVRRGDRLYGVGDPPNGLWAVLSGQAQLRGYLANGVEFLVLILRPGAWFGEMSTFDDEPRPHDAIAFEASRLLHLPKGVLHRTVEAEPRLYRHLGQLLCMHQRAALQFIEQSTAQPVHTRLAHTLARSAADSGQCLHIRQDELAALVGVSRQSLNRHLKSFERQGLIAVGYSEVRVIDLPRLHAMSTP